jgi:hypothetical protein
MTEFIDRVLWVTATAWGDLPAAEHELAEPSAAERRDLQEGKDWPPDRDGHGEPCGHDLALDSSQTDVLGLVANRNKVTKDLHLGGCAIP